MSRSEHKVLQYLKEARASEQALVRVLQSQIAMTPRGSYRDLLSTHLAETRDHARTLGARAGDLEGRFRPVAFAFGVAETVAGQALALTKAPLDLVRGASGEEKVLKNAKDAAATEALEIATYTALERLARRAGDETTADLAVAIREDEERMLARILEELPALTDAVYGSEVDGDPTFDPATTGAADAAREAAAAVPETVEDVASAARASTAKAASGAKRTARTAGTKARTTARSAGASAEQAAKDAQGTAEQAAGTVAAAADEVRDVAVGAAKGARAGVATGAKAAREDDAAPAAVAESAAQARTKATAAKPKPAAKAEPASATPAADAAPAAGTDAPADADAEKPWAGYDELSVEEVQAVLLTADPDAAREVVAYEQANENRAGVLQAAERHIPAQG